MLKRPPGTDHQHHVAREQRMLTDALRVDALIRHSRQCEIAAAEVETGRAYERAAIAAAEREAARHKC